MFFNINVITNRCVVKLKLFFIIWRCVCCGFLGMSKNRFVLSLEMSKNGNFVGFFVCERCVQGERPCPVRNIVIVVYVFVLSDCF